MRYIKTQWNNYNKELSLEENIVHNAVLTEQLMNHIEDGVFSANRPIKIGKVVDSADASYIEIEETEESIILNFVIKKGEQGKSAYQVAVDNGFVGTENEWLDSLKGIQGKSAYQVAVDNGFVGTENEWLDSLKGSGSGGTLLQWGIF